MNLYLITKELRESLDSAFDEETGEALPVFIERRELWEKKAQAVVHYALNQDSDARQIDELIKKLTLRKKACVNRFEHIKKYLADNMKTSGISQIIADDKSFKVSLFIDRDFSIEIDDGAIFPESLCNPPKPLEPSKTKIKAAILAGELIVGARGVYKDRLEIK